jgi:hypothetical protein
MCLIMKVKREFIDFKLQGRAAPGGTFNFMQVQLQSLTPRAVARAVKWIVVLAVVGVGVIAYADHIELEELDPPVRLQSGVTIQDRVGCGDRELCVRGPYILDTDAEGSTPEDLSRLLVELDSPEDLDLLIVTGFEVQGNSWIVQERDFVCISDGPTGRDRCSITTEARLKQIRGRPIYIFIGNLTETGGIAFTLTATWEPAQPPPLSRGDVLAVG